MASKKTKKKSVGKSGGGAFQEFFIWHGEKIVVGIVAVVALWFALQGLGYQTLSWQPSELEKIAGEAETAVRNNTRTAEDEEIQIFDYATYAEQIKSPIPAEPYQGKSQWIDRTILGGSSRMTGAPSQE